jgi:hypothetical protein
MVYWLGKDKGIMRETIWEAINREEREDARIYGWAVAGFIVLQCALAAVWLLT